MKESMTTPRYTLTLSPSSESHESTFICQKTSTLVFWCDLSAQEKAATVPQQITCCEYYNVWYAGTEYFI